MSREALIKNVMHFQLVAVCAYHYKCIIAIYLQYLVATNGYKSHCGFSYQVNEIQAT